MNKKYSPIGIDIESPELYNQSVIEYPVVAVDNWRDDEYKVIQPWDKITSGCISNNPVKWDNIMGPDMKFYKPDYTIVPEITQSNFIGEITHLKLISDGGLYNGDLCYGIAELTEWTLK